MIKKRASADPQRIVFPESEDERILKAAEILYKEKLAKPILIGSGPDIKNKAQENNIDVEGIEIRDPEHDVETEKYADSLMMIRKDKGMTTEKAREVVRDYTHFGMMMIKSGHADGLVSGASHSTADTVRPALQILKTKEGINIASSYFIMETQDENVYFFADCAINIDPSSENLAEIATSTAESSRSFGIEPRVSLLSFSSRGSAKDEKADKVRKAAEILSEWNVDFVFDGELQLDSSIVPEVATKKVPDSPIEGNANILIFPDLNAGNIGYKLVERFAATKAIGPIIQGINGVVNDLSRGCDVEDIVNVACVISIEAARDR